MGLWLQYGPITPQRSSRLARLGNYIHEVRKLFLLHELESALERWPQICGISHRSFAIDTKRLGQFGIINGRIIDVSSDAGVFYRPITELCDFDPVFLGVIKGLVVVHDNEERNPVLRCCPQSTR